MKRIFVLLLLSALAFGQSTTQPSTKKEDAKKSCCEGCCSEMKKTSDKQTEKKEKMSCCAKGDKNAKEGDMCGRKEMKDDKKGN